MRAKIGSVVEVEWFDAYNRNGWAEVGQFEMDPLRTLTYGILVGKNEHNIAVAQTFNEEGLLGDIMVIPKGMLGTVTTLKTKEDFV